MMARWTQLVLNVMSSSTLPGLGVKHDRRAPFGLPRFEAAEGLRRRHVRPADGRDPPRGGPRAEAAPPLNSTRKLRRTFTEVPTWPEVSSPQGNSKVSGRPTA